MRFLHGLAVLCLATAPVASMAADLARPMKVEVPIIEDDYSSGWYIRGDIGATARMWPRISTNSTSFADERFDSAFFGGLGAGFKYQSLRMDVTGDWRQTAAVSGVAGTDRHRFAVGGQTLMLNGYYDLAPFAGFSPYVGAGIGAARITLDRHSWQPVGGGAAMMGAPLTSATRYNLAWSLMAGLAFDVTPQLKIDMGYRYLNTGNVTFGDTLGNAYRLSAPAAHEFRIGLRYMFSDGLPNRLSTGHN